MEKEEIKKLIKKEVEENITQYIKKNLSEKDIKEIVGKSLVNLFRTLYNRSGTWTKDL